MPQTKSQAVTKWRGQVLRVPVPATRDPFINTPLLALGPGPDGEERFWISTWNSNVGPLAALVTAAGQARIYRFPSVGDWTRGGFYSAVPEDPDTLWLCCNLSRVARLRLSTGKVQEFPTNAPGALMFQGMVLDAATGKLFAAAHPGGQQATGFSFDFRRRRAVKVHQGICPDLYMRTSFPNGDGTWSCVLHCPGESLLRWDPATETVSSFRLGEQLDMENLGDGTTYYLVADEAGRRYFPGRGWYDPQRQSFTPANPLPQREMTWFARRRDQVWGCNYENGNLRVGRWELATGKVHEVCTIPDGQLHNLNLTSTGKVVAVTIYGEFMRFDGQTGALELSRRLDTDACGSVDCLRRISPTRLLGTPFITQRFWELDLRTGQAADCGRAAPGCGEVLQTWKIGKKAYMAVYTGAELVEYDPAHPARFPENPRVVADPPGGMRPVAAADDGRTIFYSCSHEYGHLGCVLTAYDTVTGEARYLDDPVPAQCINSLQYDRATKSLVGGTTIQADCGSCPATAKLCQVVRLDAVDLTVTEIAGVPPGTGWVGVVGALGRGRYLTTCSGDYGSRWFALDLATFGVPPVAEMKSFPAGASGPIYTGRPGFFILRFGDRFEVWDLRKEQAVCELYRGKGIHRCFADGASVYLVSARRILILEQCLKRLK